MNVELQAFQLETDSPNKSYKNKIYSTPSNKEFEKHLENIKNIIEKPLTCDKLRKKDVLLMQVLYLLNMNIPVPDIEITAVDQLSNLDVNLANYDLNMELLSDKLTRYWQRILSEYDVNGDINQNTIKMFYLAMKKVIPDLSNMDLETLHDQINVILTNSKSKQVGSGDSNIDTNSVAREHSSTTVKIAAQGEIENTERGKPQIQHLQKSIEDDSHLHLVRNANTKVFEENHTYHNELQDRWTAQLDDNISKTQYSDVSTFLTKESFIAPSDKVDPNIVTFSAGSNRISEVFDQLVARMRLALKGDVQQVSIRLKPDHLGDVVIKVFALKDKLKAELFVDNTQVRTMLKAHALDFQNQIREQGYNFSEISVYKMSDGLEMGAFNHQSSSNNQHQGRRPKMGFNKQNNENSDIAIEEYYDPWGDASSVNYMA